MSRAKAEISARLPIRRGLSQGEAAMYLGIGASKFAQMVKARQMPRPRVAGGSKLWDVDELDAAFRDLPREGEAGQATRPNPWHTNA